MKKILAFLIIALSTNLVQAQFFNNTQWIVYDGNSSSVVAYFSFLDDTVYVSPDNTAYFPLSTYTENDDTIRFLDLDTTAFCGSYIGVYTFAIFVDTCVFTAVDDTCSARSDTLQFNKWVQFSTAGLGSQKHHPNLGLYPNPSSDFIQLTGINNKEEYRYNVYDPQGKSVLEGILSSNSKELNITRLSPGLYRIHLIGATATQIQFRKD